MKNKYEIGELVLVRDGTNGSHYATSDGTPIVYVVYQIIRTKDKMTEYVMDFINSAERTYSRPFSEDCLDPVPSNHPLFTTFGTHPSSVKKEKGK